MTKNYQSSKVDYRGLLSDAFEGTVATAGINSTAVANGEFSVAKTCGKYSNAVASNSYGHADTSGWYAIAAAIGHNGIASANGPDSWAISKYKAKAGELGTITIRWFDRSSMRFRVTTGYVGEDGIEANVWYRVDVDSGKLVRA